MNLPSLFKIGVAALVLPLAAVAQSGITTTTTSLDPGTPPGPGSLEFTFGGSGAANKKLDDSVGGLSFSIGQYIREASEIVIRQSINYSNPGNGGKDWSGATRIAFDQHIFPRGRVRPFVGVNLGGIYGDATSDSWAGGIEAGVKVHVLPRTFVYAMAEYAWLFRQTSDINNRFDDGQFNWSVGMGFHF